MLFQHCQFIERGAVEDHIGIFLEGEDPALLTLADAVPHGKGFLYRGIAGLIIPDGTPQQPQIAAGDPVVVIQVQSKQGTHIEPEHLALVQPFRQQHRVQAVEAFHNDHGVFIQPQLMTPPFPHAGFEVEAGQLHFLTFQQLGKMAAEEGSIDGVDML